MTKLILIRHGETSINVASLLHSRNDPEKLTPKGIIKLFIDWFDDEFQDWKKETGVSFREKPGKKFKKF